MIKLFHIISDTNIGGAGKYLLTYLANCDRQTFDITVIVPVESKLTAEIERLNCKVIECRAMEDKSIDPIAVLELFRILSREKPEIVHTHAVLSARIAARLAGINRIIYTRHSVFEQKAYLTKGIGKKINGIAGRLLSDRIIAVAEAAKKNLTDTGIDDKRISVIYNGVDPQIEFSDEEKDVIREKFGIAKGEYVIAIIARLELVKGHKYFVEAAEMVKKSGIKVRFVIAGTGTCENELKELVSQKKLEDTVLFTGFLSNVGELENIMDIQANASYGTEAASLSLLEGMSLGKPAVVSDFGGNPELISNGINGLVVPQKNSQAMAEAIISLISDNTLRSKISDNAKEIFKTRFTSKIMTDNMEKFYKSVLEGKDER